MLAHDMHQIAKVKQLNSVIANTRIELARTEEQQEEAKQLRAFLEQLTPPEWYQGLCDARDTRHQERLDAWVAECEAIRAKQQVRHYLVL